jgi:hypothetical protein
MLIVTDEAPSADLALLATVKIGLGVSGTDQDAQLRPLCKQRNPVLLQP